MDLFLLPPKFDRQVQSQMDCLAHFLSHRIFIHESSEIKISHYNHNILKVFKKNRINEAETGRMETINIQQIGDNKLINTSSYHPSLLVFGIS